MSGILFRLRQVGAFVRLGRPLFLGGGFVLYGLGAAIAAEQGASVRGAVDWRRFVWGQIAITATQLMTHYCNDYWDYEADRANATPTRWSGGSRVLPAGELPRVVALAAALALLVIAVAATAYLVARAGAAPGAAVLLAAAILLSWEYSAPPLRLHSTGWGELDVALVVSFLTPLIGFYVQAGRLAALPALAVLPLCCLQFAMLLAIEFPDAAGDAATGKRTLVVRFGGDWSARLYQIALVAAYALLMLAVAAGLPPLAALCALAPSPIAAWQFARIQRGAYRDPASWESLAFWSVALLISTAAGELVGFAIAR
ncbi:MAG TPA: prenyltransferase [Polyangia bacterium]|nr:prenyltransferase [Polyangia bacterium]